MAAGLSDAGLEIPTHEEIRQEIVDSIHQDVSATADTSEEQPLGQFVSIFSDRERRLWEALQAVHAAFDPDGATGSAFEALAAITGTVREEATRSTVTLDYTVDPGTYTAGTLIAHVENDPTARYVNTVDVVNGGGGPAVISAAAEAETAGPTPGFSGTINTIASAVAGWSSVTNPLDASVGLDVEAYTAMRVRREAELSSQGSANIDAIRAHLLENLPSLTEVLVFENDSAVTDPDGIPPYNIEVVVHGDAVTDQDIADEIWASKGGTVRTHGTSSATVTDSMGFTHTVRFTRQTDVPVWVRLDIEYLAASYPGDITFEEEFKTACDGYYSLGRDVNLSKLFALAHETSGVFGIPSMTISDDGISYGSASIPITVRERATFDTSRVIIDSSTAVTE